MNGSFEILFNGRPIPARENDTVASALYRAGTRIFSRSFKYHRARGLLCAAGHCPNCLMNVDGIPNVRACVTPVRSGQKVRHQNAYPSLEHDFLSIAQWFGWLMPVGFYYKTFTHPRVWHFVERFIRKAAGLGEIWPDTGSKPDYEHLYLQAGTAVVGGGRAGREAAIEAAKGGHSVVLVDDQPARDALALDGVQALPGAACIGVYEGNLLGIAQGNRMIHLRAKRIVIATGTYEVPLVFPNNDLVGVMLSSAARRLIHKHGIRPGERAVVVSPQPDGESIAADMRAGGVDVAAVVPPEVVLAAKGRGRVTGIRTKQGEIACDLIVVRGALAPNAGLVSQAGGKLEWDEARGAFVPGQLPPNVSVAGSVTGQSLTSSPVFTDASYGPKSFVCYCEDVTTPDLCQAIDEGFDHIETLKRYSTVTMGPCQGKMCQLASIGICAGRTKRAIGETGVTTSRPPNPSVSLGALAGARHHPIKRTPMHYEHEKAGAVWMDLGEWKRPRYYQRPDAADERAAVAEEYRAVRERVGVIDVSTLGKLIVTGKDAAKLLDKVYTNRLSNLRVGSARYAVICDDSGIILDDGTVTRFSEDEFFITTTTGNIEFVKQWMEWWSAGTGWCVHVTNVTGGYAAVNVAGPLARQLLSGIAECDLSAEAFPYMAARRARVAGVESLLLRLGFVGETGWEIHCPSENGHHLWDLVLEKGQPLGIRPFGVEAQRLLRLEKKHVIVGVDTDALSNPLESDMAWVAKLDKEDFIGKAAILRAQANGLRDKLVGFVMGDANVPEDGAAIVLDGKPVGRVTSARFSPAKGKAVGLAWVPVEAAGAGNSIQVRVNGRLAAARVVAEQFYDPEGKRLRM